MSAKLKICGVTTAEDLACCRELGVDAIGLNLWPGSPRRVDADRARALAGEPRGGLMVVGVFVDPTIDEVRDALASFRLDAVQLHGDADPAPIAALGVPWIRVVRGTPALVGDDALAGSPRWVLLDARVEGYGGAGRITDWAWAAGAVHHFAPTPVWLAGGIDPTNAAAALAQVRPAGLDVASGAERAPGIKDASKIAALARACLDCGGSDRPATTRPSGR